MTRLHWRDAAEAVEWLGYRETCAQIVRLLARLPLLQVAVLQQLFGLNGGASVYRSVDRLKSRGLVATIQPPVYRTHSPRLLYLTDLGLAALALDQHAEPQDVVRRLHLGREDLLALVPQLPDQLATYELLGSVSASQPGRPELIAWERPWRRSFQRPRGRTPARVTLAAHAILSWDGQVGSYLLLPDRGILPSRFYRSTLDHLFALRRSRGGSIPFLVIATTSRERKAGWERLLQEVWRARREVPLSARVAWWSVLGRDLEQLPLTELGEQGHDVVMPIELRELRTRGPASQIPRFVGDALTPLTRPEPEVHLGRIALSITPADHDLLEQVGLHPFLSPGHLADVLGWSVASVRHRMNRLTDFGLMRRLSEEEVGSSAGTELIELTRAGLELAAPHLGLSLAAAVRELGLTGGGRDNSVGPRRALLRNLAHTRDVDEIFVSFHRLAREQRAKGSDDAIEEWQNASACSRRDLRPDGYGIYRRHGVSHGFFLELDRGTMNARDYFKKFGAYYRYAVSGRFRKDYRGYPTILLVTANNASEERIARVARAVAIGQPGRLPLLLTSRWRINDLGNRDDLLAPIWRQPVVDPDHRRPWLPPLKGTLHDNYSDCLPRKYPPERRLMWEKPS